MIACEIVRKYPGKWVALTKVVKEGDAILAGEVSFTANTFETLKEQLKGRAMDALTVRYVTEQNELKQLDFVLWADCERKATADIERGIPQAQYIFLYDCEFNKNGGLKSAVYAGASDSPAVYEYMIRNYDVIVLDGFKLER